MTAIDRSMVEKLIFGEEQGRRFTQDSPILTDVWVEFALNPGKPQELIILPHREDSSGTLAESINQQLSGFRKLQGKKRSPDDSHDRQSARIAHLPGVIAARLYFDEMLCLVLPMTAWWLSAVDGFIAQQTNVPVKRSRRELASVDSPYKHFPNPLAAQHDALLARLAEDIQRVERMPNSAAQGKREKDWPDPDLIWTVRLIGQISLACKGVDGDDKIHADSIAAAFLDVFKDCRRSDDDANGQVSARVWRVSRNRDAKPAVVRSTVACKADAARLLFNVSCEHVVWAVADSGIDSRHPAFHDWRTGSGHSRVIETYDFGNLRESLRLDSNRKQQSKLKAKALEGIKAAHPMFVGNLEATDPEVLRQQEALEPNLKKEAKKKVTELVGRLRNGHDVDWELLLPFVQLDNPAESPPHSDHGTHVAGILGADWPVIGGVPATPEDCARDAQERMRLDHAAERELTGMCPDIRLIDLRVLRNPDPHGDDSNGAHSDEFEVIAALQLIRYLNTRAGHIRIHGINLSLSIEHDVVNYACGRTPICDECNQLAANGTVVVVAAGNSGHQRFSVENNRTVAGYSSVSITDPGNADGAITVGSTHRYRPHEYGVSYFSSRGPTGDGRNKPDIVAPGEKIWAPVGEDGIERKDGTSMAAPHVSGAAAMLMARHSELIGQPQMIKQVLCKTATDLGRDHYFQGAGMLDALRALQSV